MQSYKTKKQLQAALDQLAETDKPLARAYGEYGVPPMRARPDGFEGLTRLLISQQVSTAAASAIQARFDAAIGEINAVNLLAMNDDVSISASRDRSIKVWKGFYEKVVQKIDHKSQGHNFSVNTLIKINEHSFSSGGDDTKIIVFKEN